LIVIEIDFGDLCDCVKEITRKKSKAVSFQMKITQFTGWLDKSRMEDSDTVISKTKRSQRANILEDVQRKRREAIARKRQVIKNSLSLEHIARKSLKLISFHVKSGEH